MDPPETDAESNIRAFSIASPPAEKDLAGSIRPGCSGADLLRFRAIGHGDRHERNSHWSRGERGRYPFRGLRWLLRMPIRGRLRAHEKTPSSSVCYPGRSPVPLRHLVVRISLPSIVVSQEGMNDSLSKNEDHSRIQLQCNRILILRQEPTYKTR
jgi:hypothetical protein